MTADTEYLSPAEEAENAILRRWPYAADETLTSWVLGPDAECLERMDCNRAPNDSGIYMLFANDDELLYIGKTIGIQYRLAQHFWAMKYRSGRKFSRFTWRTVPAFAIGAVEIAHISALKPRGNILYESSDWPCHGQMVLLVNKAWKNTSERLTYA